MKRILIPVILVVTILVGGVLAFAIWKAVPQTSKDFFNSGKKYYDQSKYSEAAIQFLNSVQKEPRNRDARYYLALSYMNQGDLNNAAKQLVALLEFAPDDVDANIRLGNIFLTGGRGDPTYFKKAEELAQKVLATAPSNVQALILMGNASAGLQDYHGSVELFEKAVALDPLNTAAIVSLGSSQALQKNYPEAEKAFLKAHEVNPKDKSALLSLANYYRAVREMDKAEAFVKEALADYPVDRDIYMQAVALYYQTDRLNDAVKVLQDVQARTPKDPAPSLALVVLYTEKKRSEDARKLLYDLKKQFPDSVSVAGDLAVNLMPDQPEQAKAELDRLLKIDPKNAAGLLLLGQIQFNADDLSGAQTTLGKIPQTSSVPQVEFLQGEIAMKQALPDDALQHFQKALAMNGGYVAARVGVAEALMTKGKLTDSRAELVKVLAVAPNFAPARFLKVALDMGEKNYTQVEPELNALVKEQPKNPLYQRQLGLFYETRGRTADAEKNLVNAFELQSNSPASLQDLVQFYVRTKQPDKALQKINSVPDDKKQAFHYELLGLVYSQTGKLQDAESAYRKALEKDPSDSNAVGFLASVYIQGGHPTEALKELDVLTSKNASNSGAYTIKGMIYENQGKVEEAKQNYTQSLKADPNSEIAGNNLAFILAEQGQDLNTALGYAQMARKKRPDTANIADTLGWVYFKLGNYLLARDQLQFAVGKQPDNAEFQYHLGMIYKGNKQTPEAQAALKKAVSSPKDFKEKSLAEAALKELAAAK